MGPTFPAENIGNTAILKYKGIHFIFQLQHQENKMNKYKNAELTKLCVFRSGDDSESQANLIESLNNSQKTELS